VQALVRIGRRALHTPLLLALAVGAFIAMEFARVPFPVVLLVAAAVGAFALRQHATSKPSTPVSDSAAPAGQSIKVAAVGLVLWVLPLVAVALTLGATSLWTQVYLFFTKAALVTFGGAYAVLGYVTTHLVGTLQWVDAEQSVAGLALAETTPGPLVIVLQFMGFMAGWNQPGMLSPLGSALLAGALASWATFLPSFVFILLGAPHVDRLTRHARIQAALGAITAAVVGVIATLALLLAQVVLFPDGWRHAPDWSAVLIAIVAWLLLERVRWPLGAVLVAAAAAGLLVHLLR
jgi:chromate transporter